MEQRDYLKDQIEQLGKVLARILGAFFGLKSQGNIIDLINQTNQNLLSELNIDIENLVQLENNELKNYIETLNLAENHLDDLTQYLYDIGVSKKDLSNEESAKYFKAAIQVLAIAESESQTFIFERMEMKNEINKEINN